jgi:hypothetical protein
MYLLLLLLQFNHFALSSPHCLGLGQSACLTDLTLRKTVLQTYLSLDIVSSFLSTLAVSDTMPPMDPYECVIKGDILRSLYVDYNDGQILTWENYTEVDGFSSCDWTYRVALYEIQFTFTSLLRHTDLPFLDIIMGYNTSKFSGYNATANCYNLLPNVPVPARLKLAHYWLNVTSVPYYEIFFTRLQNRLRESIFEMEACIQSEQKKTRHDGHGLAWSGGCHPCHSGGYLGLYGLRVYY